MLATASAQVCVHLGHSSLYFVIVDIPVIYVCCFASVMRKQVNYHTLNSIYGPYGGKVRPLIGYQI